jgi:hypothetical protein
MNQSAHVASLQAIRDFRAALITFCDDARDALAMLDIEVRRGQQFIVEEQMQFWQRQIHVCGDAVQAAKSELDRARQMPVPGGHASCREERMALERAQMRVRTAYEKEELTRRWSRKVDHEVAEYNGRAMQLVSLLDGKMPQAVAFLDRVLDDLAAYLAVGGNTAGANVAPRRVALPTSEAQPEHAPESASDGAAEGKDAL